MTTTAQHDPELVTRAVGRAARFLLHEAAAGFPEASHEMRFPHAAGFGGRSERQRSDVFARAVLGSILLDIADLAGAATRLAARARTIARREAAHVAAARLTDRRGGWSYFPDLRELPPDADSLAAALLLLARASPGLAHLCDEPVRLALAGARPDGSVGTWIVSPTDDPAARAAMRWGIEQRWGDSVDPEVCAHLYRALHAYDPDRYREQIDRGVDYLLASQEPSGGWTATWYCGDAYATAIVVGLLETLGRGASAVARARRRLLAAQRPDGGWGPGQTLPLDTALALWTLASAPPPPPEPVAGGLATLIDYQALDGGWGASPWIKMDVGRLSGRSRIVTHQSRTITTAFCLRSLLLCNARLRAAGGGPAPVCRLDGGD